MITWQRSGVSGRNPRDVIVGVDEADVRADEASRAADDRGGSDCSGDMMRLPCEYDRDAQQLIIRYAISLQRRLIFGCARVLV